MTEGGPDIDDLTALQNAALRRMARAAKRGTGCNLTADMIRVLNLTLFGEIWSDPERMSRAKESQP